MWLLDGIFTACWRRCFGEGKLTGLIGNRTFQAIVFVLIQTAFWCYKDHALSWLTLGIAIYVYIFYWSKAIGCVLDYGQAWWQTHKNYDRWWTKPLNWVLHKFGVHKYYGVYDFWWTICRYTLCLLPFVYWGHHIWIAGLFSAPVYWFDNWLFKKYPSLYKVFDDSKDMSEILFGFISGFVFWLGW